MGMLNCNAAMQCLYERQAELISQSRSHPALCRVRSAIDADHRNLKYQREKIKQQKHHKLRILFQLVGQQENSGHGMSVCIRCVRTSESWRFHYMQHSSKVAAVHTNVTVDKVAGIACNTTACNSNVADIACICESELL